MSRPAARSGRTRASGPPSARPRPGSPRSLVDGEQHRLPALEDVNAASTSPAGVGSAGAPCRRGSRSTRRGSRERLAARPAVAAIITRLTGTLVSRLVCASSPVTNASRSIFEVRGSNTAAPPRPCGLVAHRVELRQHDLLELLLLGGQRLLAALTWVGQFLDFLEHLLRRGPAAVRRPPAATGARQFLETQARRAFRLPARWRRSRGCRRRPR